MQPANTADNPGAMALRAEYHAAAMSGEAEQQTADDYREFAAQEAAGRSELYVRLGKGVADDPEVLRFLAGLPPGKRQPQLLLAAVRYLAGVPGSYAALRAVVLDRGGELAPVMLARRVQTNEPARCATLLPALAALPQPLALLEVGASAGLCLLPDRYGYDYGTRRIAGQPGAPVLRCRCLGPVPLPDRPVQVAWRAGIDLNPLDVTDPDDVRWLSCLVWPGEGDRAARLAAAIEVARRDPPRVVRGDLTTRLAATAAGAPAGATLVVFHSSVLAYVSPAERREFAAAVAGLGAVWLAQEAPAVMSSVPGFPRSLPAKPPGWMTYVLTRDGRHPLGYADGHGTWLSWAS
jgi:hypothetical protein